MGRPPQQRYAPVGRCIYCGRTEPPLSREHIIPYGLDGDLILPKASCSDCSAITGRFEGTCLRGVLLGPRALMKMQSRRDPPSEIEILAGEGKARLPIDDAPIMLMLPTYDLPAMLGGPAEGAPRHWSMFWRPLRVDMKQMAAMGFSSFGGPVLHSLSFCRMLAKIAHSMAVVSMGFDGFRPFLNAFILRGEGFIHRYVGGEIENNEPASDATHEIIVYAHPLNDVVLVVAKIRLFANGGGPIFLVVVGEALETQPVVHCQRPPHTLGKTRAPDCLDRTTRLFRSDRDVPFSREGAWHAVGVNDRERATRAVKSAAGKRLTYRGPH
jgi:hypothetical protein